MQHCKAVDVVSKNIYKVQECSVAQKQALTTGHERVTIFYLREIPLNISPLFYVVKIDMNDGFKA